LTLLTSPRTLRRGETERKPQHRCFRKALRTRASADCQDAVSRGKIFICYRHEDSSAYAGWLADAIGRQFGKARVFRDVDSQRGVDFRDQVSEAIGSCAALLAVIGPSWLRVQDEAGRRRIDHPRDLVAHERLRRRLEAGLRGDGWHERSRSATQLACSARPRSRIGSLPSCSTSTASRGRRCVPRNG
jgi:TIR domain